MTGRGAPQPRPQIRGWRRTSRMPTDSRPCHRSPDHPPDDSGGDSRIKSARDVGGGRGGHRVRVGGRRRTPPPAGREPARAGRWTVARLGPSRFGGPGGRRGIATSNSFPSDRKGSASWREAHLPARRRPRYMEEAPGIWRMTATPDKPQRAGNYSVLRARTSNMDRLTRYWHHTCQL